MTWNTQEDEYYMWNNMQELFSATKRKVENGFCYTQDVVNGETFAAYCNRIITKNEEFSSEDRGPRTPLP